uniref:glutamate-rich protein 2 isoform X2 n=1 Tax=Monopterus albus TaxID=43700 RepID=UPI0009B4D554|nr:uncharacterized protein LOC109974055 isoform X2 [Monopterus albus]
MSRLQCLGTSSTGSQKQPAVEITPPHAETHKPNDPVGGKTVTDKTWSVPAHAPPCSVQDSEPENRNVLNTEVCVPKESINITPRVKGKVHFTAVPDKQLKTKESPDSVATGGPIQAPPPIEPLPMHKANMEDEQAEEEDDEDRKAPVELLVEFLQAVKDRDLQLASKQCQMILFYEPDHPEASQFLPLIQKKLLEEQEAEENTEEEEDGDADDSDDSRSDEESSLSSSVWSSSCSSSSLAGEEEEERWVNKQEPSPPFNTSS